MEIKLNNSNNWRAAIDVPADNGIYCVEEVNVPDGWDVTYENNAQQANSTTPILVKNQKQPTDIDLTVEKTWAKDDASNRPDSISLTLLQSNGKKQDNSDAANTREWFWEELRISTPTPTKNGNKWTFAYTGLPASDAFVRTNVKCSFGSAAPPATFFSIHKSVPTCLVVILSLQR